ncbi:uncharacterized protein LOC107365530 [Tetranychus urticae]|uniref:Uncharacterized protein n=1 Tax=Tetranychus urticae TaxID=32264 RepID=T1KMK8_TETUR|nr:uncharacterized protein LOC107365530 [Tetranychus urticae]
MKFSLALIAIFCVSAISAAPVKEPSPFVQAVVNLVEGFVQRLEKPIPGWDNKASLEKNVLAVIDKPLEAKVIPGWNPDASVRDNLISATEAYVKSLKIQGLDENKSVAENVKIVVSDFVDKLPIPSIFPKDQIKQDFINNVLEQLKKIQFKGFDLNKSVDEDITVVVDDVLEGVKGYDPKASLEDYVNAAVKNLLDQIRFPGYSPNKTLDENVAEFLENVVFKDFPL